MNKKWKHLLGSTVLFIPSFAFAQQSCMAGVRIDGTVMDQTGAVIPGALVQTSKGETVVSDASGYFLLPCTGVSSGTITATAQGFNPATSAFDAQTGGSVHLNFRLAIAKVDTVVEVNADAAAMDSDRTAGTVTLNTSDIQNLPDDPDDLLRQLQTLSASGGGSSASSIIRVDGFQNGSALPPKSSIATLRVNPDLFSSEYQTPPWDAGLIEVVTKPGVDAFHGGLFYTGSYKSFNATDPLSASSTPASKQWYGFELSGPIAPQKSGFALTLEKRDVKEFSIINAMTLDANGNQVPLRQAVSAPQTLWTASARGDWQVNAKDVAVLSFFSNVNNQGNQGVGGLTLAEAGYSSLLTENDLRFTNSLAINADLLMETRAGYSWKRNEQHPLSTSPSIQVSGFFIGGGAPSQNLNDRERDLEVDNDLLATRGKHQLKLGVQSIGIFEHDYDPNNFNGSFVFGGGTAPILNANNLPTGQTTTISGIEQYRRAQNNLPGGTPTTYQQTSGLPVVPITQWQVGLYLQDTVKFSPTFTAGAGLRYALQTSPDSGANFGPRVSLSWSPDRKQAWVFRARVGLFSGIVSPAHAIEAARLNQIRQHEVTVYSPSYSSPLTPIAGAIEVGTTRQFPPSLEQPLSYAGYFNVERELPHHWNVMIDFYLGSTWNVLRMRNINAPMVQSSMSAAPDPTVALLAPRPFAPNLNILQYQNSGHFAGHVLSFVVDQRSYKYFSLYSYYAYRSSRTDGGNGDVEPQSNYSDAGEAARADWARTNSFFLVGNVDMPFRLKLATQFAAQEGTPYNITTGTDNNGDGSFNDRPSYSPIPGAGIYGTRFGLLTVNTVNGNVPRNLGTMPPVIHLDTNLSRTFKLTPKDKTQQRTISFNLRSSNLLNHTNVATVQTVLSPSLGQPLTAEAGRRLELGARFAF